MCVTALGDGWARGVGSVCVCLVRFTCVCVYVYNSVSLCMLQVAEGGAINQNELWGLKDHLVKQ